VGLNKWQKGQAKKYSHITKETRNTCKRVGHAMNIKKKHRDSSTFPFTVMKHIHYTGVVSIIYYIVWSIMNFDLYSVSSIFNQKNDRILPISNHGRHILDCDMFK